jgi:hypothetical protein
MEPAIEDLRRQIDQLVKEGGLASDDPKVLALEAEIDRLQGIDPSAPSTDKADPDSGADDPLQSGEVECEAIPGITDDFDAGRQPRCVTIALKGRASILTMITDRGEALAIYWPAAGADAQSKTHAIPEIPDLASAKLTVGDNGVVVVDGTSFSPQEWFDI